MGRIAWITDIHLNFLEPLQVLEFLYDLEAREFEALLLSGDLAEADSLFKFLPLIEQNVSRPVYFILGNHDYYHRSISGVDQALRDWCAGHPRLRFLEGREVIPLSERTALVGLTGWADGRYGDYAASDVVLNDYLRIEDFVRAGTAGRTLLQRLFGFFQVPEGSGPGLGRRKGAVYRLLNHLGDEAAARARETLARSLADFETTLFMTHFPPFAEACFQHDGLPIGDRHLPHFACKAMGEVLLELAGRFPHRKLLVLCGHTHGRARLEITPNLEIWVGRAEYGAPVLEEVMEID